jgi:predicted dehydrogenase
MAEQPVKIGLIGLGNMGRNHLRVLSMLKGAELTFVADSDPEVAAKIGNSLLIPGVVDPALLLERVDAVVICTPTITHADYIQLASSRVKNIFVEKPLAANHAEAVEIAAFANARGLNLQVGFIERFNPAVQALRTVLERSGGVINLDFTRTNKISSRITDVDVITDLMIHDIDLALYLNGPARSVSAHGYAQSDMVDFASALITHQNGQFSRIQASRITDKKIRKIEGTCTDMFVDCDLLRKEILISRQAEACDAGSLPYAISAIQETVAVAPQEALLSELQAFISICHERGRVDVPGIEAGVEAMKICAQIQSAVKNHD